LEENSGWQPRSRLFLRHAGLAQSSEIGGVEQSADIRYQRPKISGRLQAGDARVTVVKAEPAGFNKFGGGALDLAGEGVDGGEIAADRWMFRSIAARLLEPGDRLVSACSGRS
jgi:hypothetical protein